MCWLLVVSVGLNRPVRTHILSHTPCRFLSGRVPSKAFIRSSSHRGNVCCAEDSPLRHAVDALLCSVAPPPLRRLDHTGHHLALAGDADRPIQKQVPTRGSKRAPASTGETAWLYQNGPHASSSSRESGSDLDTSPVHRPGRRRSCGGIVKVFVSSESTHPEEVLLNRKSQKRQWH